MPVNIFPLVVFDFGAFGFSIMYIDALDPRSGPAKKMAPLGETHSMYFPSPHVVCKNLLSLGPFA